MRFLDEHCRRPAALSDHLAWAALVAPGVVLNKDGSFLAAFRFPGPDLVSATEDELMAVRARLNNALKRLGAGWCLHVEAQRRPAAAYPESDFDIDAAWLIDEARRSRFETADPAFETDFRLALTWLPQYHWPTSALISRPLREAVLAVATRLRFSILNSASCSQEVNATMASRCVRAAGQVGFSSRFPYDARTSFGMTLRLGQRPEDVLVRLAMRKAICIALLYLGRSSKP